VGATPAATAAAEDSEMGATTTGEAPFGLPHGTGLGGAPPDNEPYVVSNLPTVGSGAAESAAVGAPGITQALRAPTPLMPPLPTAAHAGGEGLIAIPFLDDSVSTDKAEVAMEKLVEEVAQTHKAERERMAALFASGRYKFEAGLAAVRAESEAKFEVALSALRAEGAAMGKTEAEKLHGYRVAPALGGVALAASGGGGRPSLALGVLTSGGAPLSGLQASNAELASGKAQLGTSKYLSAATLDSATAAADSPGDAAVSDLEKKRTQKQTQLRMSPARAKPRDGRARRRCRTRAAEGGVAVVVTTRVVTTPAKAQLVLGGALLARNPAYGKKKADDRYVLYKSGRVVVPNPPPPEDTHLVHDPLKAIHDPLHDSVGGCVERLKAVGVFLENALEAVTDYVGPCGCSTPSALRSLSAEGKPRKGKGGAPKRN
jgi:hypothetical protein